MLLLDLVSTDFGVWSLTIELFMGKREGTNELNKESRRKFFLKKNRGKSKQHSSTFSADQLPRSISTFSIDTLPFNGTISRIQEGSKNIKCGCIIIIIIKVNTIVVDNTS